MTRPRDICEPFTSPEDADLEPLRRRIGDARVVLLGEATHGTSEFYRLRARITRDLIEHAGFGVVAVEADWPDAARIDHYVRDRDVPASEWKAFARFPTWMWRNAETRELVDWLRDHNLSRPPEERVRFAGLDLYGLYNSIDAILRHLEEVDEEVARVARERYACLDPWQDDPAGYGHAALTGTYRSCEADVVRMLQDLLQRRVATDRRSDEAFFESVENARVIADAEAYYRVMYYGSRQSWNLRDRHMFDTLRSLLAFHGESSRIVVWAHNSHLGDARATEMSRRGEHNLGQLCRQRLGRDTVYSLGFGTDHGTVYAARDWGEPGGVREVVPGREDSYEGFFHRLGVAACLLPLEEGAGADPDLLRQLTAPRLERAIGVLYRPRTERASHYFEAVLPAQFDEYAWIDETSALRPLASEELAGVPETYPFGL
jgi:erythromycin esterase-like protein